MTILSGTMWVPSVALFVVSQCLAFRYYTWVKATNQTQAQPPARPVDLEALNRPNDNKDESIDMQAREKASGSDTS